MGKILSYTKPKLQSFLELQAQGYCNDGSAAGLPNRLGDWTCTNGTVAVAGGCAIGSTADNECGSGSSPGP